MNWLNLESLAGAFIYTATSGLVLIFVYGRGLLQIRDSMAKTVIIRVVIGSIIVPFALIGFWRGLDNWLIAPAIIWLCAVYIESERIWLKKKHSGAPPVEEQVPAFSLMEPFTTTKLAVRRYEQSIPSWTKGRIRIAHISDIHAHNNLAVEYFHGVIAELHRWKPDTVFVTGDFVTRIKYASLLPGILKDLHAPLGVYACLGNHDYWSDPKRIAAELAETKVALLGREGKVLDGGGGDKLAISHCDDPWSESRWSKPEIGGDVPLAVLAHTADNIYRLSKDGADMVFSGHYHAGQAALPWYGSIVVPSRYGRRFDHGHFVVGSTDLYVTAGIGAAFPPFRLYCNPEILIVDLVPANAAHGVRNVE